jgi:hypothetical protein
LLSLLGEALSRRALLEPGADEAALAQAEMVLRHALDLGAVDNSHAAWWLQALLAIPQPTKDPATSLERLQEAIALLRKGVTASGSSPVRMRWQSALLRAELEDIRRAPLGDASRRLRFVDLHARYADAMRAEQSPEVLSAWVELLCACAKPLAGGAALKRYVEIDDVLKRLSSTDAGGRWYKSALTYVLRCRLHLESDEGKRALLARAESVLDGGQDAPPSQRLEASKLALMRAMLEQDPLLQQKAYVRALDLARPLTAVPSLAVPALNCALKALLAMREDKERRVYARCLQIIMPADSESLGLLAENAYRDGMSADACRYFEQAMRDQHAELPNGMFNLWQQASSRWAEQSGRNNEWQSNQRHLRLASSLH